MAMPAVQLEQFSLGSAFKEFAVRTACCIGLTSLSLLLYPSLVAAQQPPAKAAPRPLPDTVVLEPDIEYGRAGERSLKLDLLRPKAESAEPMPVIAFIHGGGWQGGDKAGPIRTQLVPFAAGGKYLCVSIGYRLSGEATWPAQIHDCKAAIRWLRANAKKYNLNPDKIGVWGGSAGGHLVSLLGTSGGVQELEGTNGNAGQSSRVACVVDYCGPSNFLAFSKDSPRMRQPDSPVFKLFGGPLADKQAEATAASPVTHVSGDEPPFLVVHGTQDATVPISQAEMFFAALQKAGVDATFVKMEGGGHGIGGPDITARVEAFFDKHLRGQDVKISSEPIQVAAEKQG